MADLVALWLLRLQKNLFKLIIDRHEFREQTRIKETSWHRYKCIRYNLFNIQHELSFWQKL